MIAIVAILLALDGSVSQEELLQRAKETSRAGQYQEAIKLFKQANEQAGSKCVECLAGLAMGYSRIGDLKGARQSCERMLEAASDDLQRSEAHNHMGVVLNSAAGLNKKKLQAAEREFRNGLELNSKNTILHFNLGFNLLKQARDAEGVTELQTFLQQAPSHPAATDARRFVDNPSLPREKYAPYFELTAKDGSLISPETLRGKVVLLDFWATWCKPCVESVSSLQSCVRKYPKDSFVLVSISGDNSKINWLSFLDSHQMDWTHAHDPGRRVIRAFGADAIPTYVVLDADGVVRYSATGNLAGAQGAVEKALKGLAERKPRPSS